MKQWNLRACANVDTVEMEMMPVVNQRLRKMVQRMMAARMARAKAGW